MTHVEIYIGGDTGEATIGAQLGAARDNECNNVMGGAVPGAAPACLQAAAEQEVGLGRIPTRPGRHPAGSRERQRWVKQYE
jgi:hypothetical protein